MKILVANRGEIACRVLQAARELGLQTVAMAAAVDSKARHLSLADEAIRLDAAPLAAYMDIDRIVDLAQEVGAGAIHPGYGFVSENVAFAEACRERNLVFVGPPPSVLALSGNKAKGKQVMGGLGLAVIPGSDGLLSGVDHAKAVAKKIGYPVAFKAAAGAGGRGIRICHREAQVEDGYAIASQEAESAFGSGDLILEKFIARAHHVEFQVLGDQRGNVIHLGERDCSIQRRNQKLIEIAPSLLLDAHQRAEAGSKICRAMRSLGFHGSATVECLVDPEGTVYFLEINGRIQVEHPITEEVTKVDIVKEGLRVAMGQTLRYRQEDVRVDGYAIECRINAEDPGRDFAPSVGRLEDFDLPTGLGVRVESAARSGDEVLPHYDSLLAKLIVHAPTWPEAVARMKWALQGFRVSGVRTTIPSYLRVMDDDDFRAGAFDTGYVASHPRCFEGPHPSSPRDLAAVMAAAIAAAESDSDS